MMQGIVIDMNDEQLRTRLVKRSGERRPLVKRYCGARTGFARIYTGADVLLLAHTRTLHGTLSGLATKKLMERALRLFGDTRHLRLAIGIGRSLTAPPSHTTMRTDHVHGGSAD